VRGWIHLREVQRIKGRERLEHRHQLPHLRVAKLVVPAAACGIFARTGGQRQPGTVTCGTSPGLPVRRIRGSSGDP
jgi:hypothetical protein